MKHGVSRVAAHCCRAGALASAEESLERIEHASWERTRFLRPIWPLLCKRPLRTAVYLARNSWYFVDGQIDVVSGAGRRATRGGELIGNRADGRTLERYPRLQRLRRIMARRFVHDLSPNRQRQSSAIAAGNNRGRLIESDPHTAGQRAGVPDKPGVFIIVCGAGLACCR